jgi:hypothetical protein
MPAGKEWRTSRCISLTKAIVRSSSPRGSSGTPGDMWTNHRSTRLRAEQSVTDNSNLFPFLIPARWFWPQLRLFDWLALWPVSPRLSQHLRQGGCHQQADSLSSRLRGVPDRRHGQVTATLLDLSTFFFKKSSHERPLHCDMCLPSTAFTA